MTKLHISLTDEDTGHIFSEWSEDLADTWMGEDATMGEIYRACRDEYGRCQSKVYVDTADGAKQVGWFFVKRDEYDDGGSYLRGAWVSVS